MIIRLLPGIGLCALAFLGVEPGSVLSYAAVAVGMILITTALMNFWLFFCLSVIGSKTL